MTKDASILGNASMFGSVPSLKILVMANQMTPSVKKKTRRKETNCAPLANLWKYE
jgi:hypothetical protein